MTKEQLPDREMGFLDHISDLRNCLLRCCWIFVITSSICFYFEESIFDFLWQPYISSVKDPATTKINYVNILDPITLAINLSLISGILLGLPFALYELFKFVAPGLKQKEIKAFRIYSIVGSILFLLGVATAYQFLLPRLAEGMEYWRQKNAISNLSAPEYITTVLKLILGMGLACQFPLILFFAVKIGIIKVETLCKNRKYIFVLILIIAAIATPPDILSMIVVAIPFYGMFELTIISCRLLIKE